MNDVINRFLCIYGLGQENRYLQSNFNGSNIFWSVKFILDMDSSSRWRLIIASGQEANKDNLRVFSIFYQIMVRMLSVLIRIALKRQFWWIHTTYIFMIKWENFPKISLNIFLSYWMKFLGSQKWVWVSHGKRAIGVQVVEVLLYFQYPFQMNSMKTDQGVYSTALEMRGIE